MEDRARPHPYAEIRKVLEAELGGAENVDALFEEFEETATAAASLAQVGGGGAGELWGVAYRGGEGRGQGGGHSLAQE